MKALTVLQPYASLIADGEKWIENRTWYTDFRGQLAIHAGQGTKYLTRKEIDERGLVVGHVIATCRMVACVPIDWILAKDRMQNEKIPGSSKTWRQAAEHKHAEGPYCWILEDVVKLETPLPAKGMQKIWEWR